jgi:small subunit ribosomal protein S2
MYSKVKKLQFADFTLGQLVSSGVHIGHRSIATDPRIFEMLAGDRNGISILRLERSLAGLKPGLSVLAKVVAKRGKILFPNVDPRVFGAISTRIKKFCLRYFLVDRKIPGLLTNFMVIRRSFSDLQKTKIAPSFTFGFTSNDHHILWESNLLNLPSIGVFDSNTNPMGHAFYPVPGNDDSFSALHLYYQLTFRALGDGLNRYLFKWGATKKFKVKRLVNRFYNLTLIRPKSISNRILNNYEDLKINFIPKIINISEKNFLVLSTLRTLTRIFYINVLSYLVNQTYYSYNSIPGGTYSKYPFLNIGLDFFSHNDLFPYPKLVRLSKSIRAYLGYKRFFKFTGSYDYSLFDQLVQLKTACEPLF